jgi:CBS domain-containing protein
MGLVENLRTEHVGDLPLREAVKVDGQDAVDAVIGRMREKQLGCAIVVDGDGKPLGIFTERKVIEMLLEHPQDFGGLPVGEHLERDCFIVQRTDPLIQVVAAVSDHGARFVCVVDEHGRAVGLTGQKGLSEYLADYFPKQVMVQRIGGKPGMENREGA